MSRDWCLSAQQLRLLRLLEYMADESGTFLHLEGFYDHDEARAGEAFEDVEHLNQRGMVDKVLTMGGIQGAAASLKPGGREHVAAIRAARRNRAARNWACREAMHSWLYDQEAVGPTASITWTAFDLDLRSLFYGEPFRADERDNAAGWLQRQGLIDGVNMAEVQGPVSSYVTDEGERCAERFGCNVKEYQESKEAPSMGNTTWNVTGHSVQIATGDHATQVAQLGPEIEQITLALDGLLELASGSGVDDAVVSSLSELADAAKTDIGSEAPMGAPTHSFIARVKDAVVGVASQATTAAITAAASGIAHDVDQVVRQITS